MSNNVYNYCNINEINTNNLDLQDLINILSLKNYEPIPHYTKKDMQEAYIIALENVGIYSKKLKRILILHFFKNILLCYKKYFVI